MVCKLKLSNHKTLGNQQTPNSTWPGVGAPGFRHGGPQEDPKGQPIPRYHPKIEKGAPTNKVTPLSILGFFVGRPREFSSSGVCAGGFCVGVGWLVGGGWWVSVLVCDVGMGGGWWCVRVYCVCVDAGIGVLGGLSLHTHARTHTQSCDSPTQHLRWATWVKRGHNGMLQGPRSRDSP